MNEFIRQHLINKDNFDFYTADLPYPLSGKIYNYEFLKPSMEGSWLTGDVHLTLPLYGNGKERYCR